MMELSQILQFGFLLGFFLLFFVKTVYIKHRIKGLCTENIKASNIRVKLKFIVDINMAYFKKENKFQ